MEICWKEDAIRVEILPVVDKEDPLDGGGNEGASGFG
jgi:hypothetical protein